LLQILLLAATIWAIAQSNRQVAAVAEGPAKRAVAKVVAKGKATVKVARRAKK